MSSIDVIVPCYKYAHFLKECVESVLAGGVPAVRVVIIDDASPDNTAEVANALARSDARVNVIRHPVNKGHIATYNEGIEWVSADYLLLLSADDYLLPGALRRATDLLDAHPEMGFVFGNVINSAESGIRNSPDLEPIGDKVGAQVMSGLEFIRLIESKGTINIVPTATAVVRTSLQKRVGGYLSELPHSGDLEMWLRLAAYASVGSLETYQAVYRRHGQNMQTDYYNVKRGLPDMAQRKAALDCFHQSCKSQLPNADQIHRDLLRPLGGESIKLAHAAFDEGDRETSDQFARIAAETDPQIKHSAGWKTLFWKRCLGVHFWRKLRVARQRIGNLRRRAGNLVRKTLRLGAG
jgi:hypothetical protein